MIVFEADKKPLHFVLDQVEQHQVALPDFQRSFVWNAGMVRELLVSIFSSYPAGALLLLQGGAQVFAPRPVESAPPLVGLPPYLVLDGQQRLTSLYQAFRGTGSHRFFLNVGSLVDDLRAGDPPEVDDAVVVYPVRRAAHWDYLDRQAADLMLPISSVASYLQWMLAVKQRRDDDDLDALLVQINAEVIRAYEQYQFPVTTLAASTPTDAVCSIFETLNRTGVKLSVFELLTARAFASQHRLRDRWEQSKSTHPILEEFRVDPYDLLQVVSLWSKGGSKRSQVLSMTPDEIVGRWDEAARCMAQALKMLRHECGALSPRWIPYGPAIVTMSAVWPVIASASGPDVGARRAKLRMWFWIASFGGRYDNAATTAVAQDTTRVTAWLDGGSAPDYVDTFRFDRGRWVDVTPRQRALYRASMALLMAGRPLDFHHVQPLTQQIIESEGVDDHHIFPSAYLKRSRQDGPVDSILNRTLIDRITNIRISAKPPSAYLADIASALGDKVDHILSSHHIPVAGTGDPRNDDFTAFLEARLDKFEELLVAAIGRPLLPQDQPVPDSVLSDDDSDPLRDFRAALGDLWDQVEPKLVDTSVEELESLAESVRMHLSDTALQLQARRLATEVEGMLGRWAEYDATQRRIARASASYFLEINDKVRDTDAGGLDDDAHVIRAAESVLGGWVPADGKAPEADDTASLTADFGRAMKDVYVKARKEAGYNATVYLRMLAEHGALGTARKLLASPGVSDGFVALWERGRVDLAVENVVLRPEFASLFTDDEREVARARLAEYGLDVD